MRLSVNTKETEWGYYLSTTYKGVKYGQGYYKGETMQEAQANFFRIVQLMSSGQTWRVTAGAY
jgi:hypothetical protein